MVDTWLLKLSLRFSRIRLFYNIVGLLPQVSDPLTHEDMALIIRGGPLTVNL